jgi:ABC-type transporter lipoprotein component MlaA
MPRIRLMVGIALAAWLQFGCATTDSTGKEQTVSVMGVSEHRRQTTGESYELIQYVNDPIEPFNRGSFHATKGAIDYGVRPAAIGWRAVFPKAVRTSIDNFAYNLNFPDRFVSLLLQGKVIKAGTETGNFLINTTAGVAGFFDVAKPLGVPTYKEDVGQAFGKWGIGPGFYFVIPLLGPSSGRDTVGKVFDVALSPATWVPTYGIPFVVFTVNGFSSRINTYDMMTESGMDLYLPVRTLWAINRDIAVSDYQIPEIAWADADPNPSLGVMLTKLDDPNFPVLHKRGEASSTATGKQVPYSLWMQEQPAPLVFIIPGIGSHRSTTNAVKLAESAWQRGYSAAIVSSPFNPEFILSGLTATYPGYTPSDAEDLYRALGEIRSNIESNHPGKVTSSSLMGYSLGGIATLFISQLERKATGPGALHFERIVAINPAVNLDYASGLFDSYFDAPLDWPEGERRDMTTEAVKKAYVLAQGEDEDLIRRYKTLPFTRDGSEFLIGLSSRAMTMQAIAACSERGGKTLSELPGGAAGGFHGPFAVEVESNTLKRYMDELAIPYFADKEGGARTQAQLFDAANLYSQEAGLRDDERIAVFTNKDDFILQPSDLGWLESVFAGRITVFPGGGHLGNLYMPQVQAAFMEALGATEKTADAK